MLPREHRLTRRPKMPFRSGPTGACGPIGTSLRPSTTTAGQTSAPWRITLQGLTGRQQGNSFSASGSQIEPSTLGQTFAAAIASQASHLHANPFSTAQSQGSQLVRFLREGFLIKSYWKPTLKQHHFQLVPMRKAPSDIQAQANRWRHAQHGPRQR